MLLSESMSVVEGRVNVMDEDLKEFLERRTAETSLAVAELGEKLEMKRREVSDLTSFVFGRHPGGGSASRRSEGEGAPC